MTTPHASQAIPVDNRAPTVRGAFVQLWAPKAPGRAPELESFHLTVREAFDAALAVERARPGLGCVEVSLRVGGEILGFVGGLCS